MRPLNEYPKEELELLLSAASQEMRRYPVYTITFNRLSKWCDILKEAISDQEFEEKQLPFNEPSK